ncbi:hypothetical protein Vadar_011937 [Vaccinium darrowii]|uniref:Uncharacterized protein n=1 Tax=Vaccinium darrowii TaxID=229202 RepID=A0ACB7ZC24_9ERIC|nr:hypothetical protein Vadar_011937 [Vaccinium darrowii]
MGTYPCALFTSKKDQNPLEFNFMSNPTSEIEEKQQEHERKQGEEEEEEEKREILVSSLRIKTPSRGETKKDEEEEEEDGFRTPPSLDQRIPLISQCPPAPRKPKSIPSRKRKSAYGGGITIIDLSSEVEALFPSSIVVDLGGKINKVRKVN